MAVAAVAIITVRVIAVAIAVGMAAAVVMAPGKSSGKNPKKSSLRRKRGFPLRLSTQKGAQIGVINVPFNISPA